MEGASLRLYEEQLAPCRGQRLVAADGERAAQAEPLVGSALAGVEARGKLLYLKFDSPEPAAWIRIHCLMFGDVRINRGRDKRLTLGLDLQHDRVAVYLGAARRIEPAAADPYDPRLDVVRETWDPAHAAAHMRAKSGPDRLLVEALLDQALFPGLGNKMKNEALWAERIDPRRTLAELDGSAVRRVLDAIRAFALDWLDAVRQGGDHVSPPCATYRKKRCPRCETPYVSEGLGDPPRKCVWCPACQTG